MTAVGCATGSDTEPPVDMDRPNVVVGDAPADAVATDITAPEPGSAAGEPDAAVDTGSAPASTGSDGSDPEVQDPESPAAGNPEPGFFADDQTTELAVSILLSQSGLGNGQTRPIGFAVGLANREVGFEGSPFEFGLEGGISVPVGFNDDGDLTDDLDKLRTGIEESLDQQGADLFIAAVPSSIVAETTQLAAERGIPTVLVNHVDDGSAPRLDVRIDMAGSVELADRALVATVVTTENDGIVVVGPVGDVATARVEQLLFEAGAEPVVVDAPLGAPSPGALIEAREQIGKVGERPVVIVLTPSWLNPLAETMASTSARPTYIATDRVLGRADIAALDGIGEGELTMVRRVDDLRRPEQAEFANRVFEGQSDGATTYAAESYDAYALAAIASAAAGAADSASMRSGMIEASRGGESCSVLADCITLAASGVDVDYDGVSGPIDLDDDGSATAAWFSIDIVDPATGGDASSRFVLQRI